MYKIDLHTHSQASPDGALSAANYRQLLKHGRLDFVAVTDHNTIDFAEGLHEELGEKIVVGEEITAREGEIIGLFLHEVIPPHLSVAETVAKIHEQGAIVYVPHPFETARKGLPLDIMDKIAEQIDVVEMHNGRAIFQNKGEQAEAWAKIYHKPVAASSDAHGRVGWGKTYSIVSDAPTRSDLVRLLASATYQKGYVGARGVLYPKLNRLQRKFGRA